MTLLSLYIDCTSMRRRLPFCCREPDAAYLIIRFVTGFWRFWPILLPRTDCCIPDHPVRDRSFYRFVLAFPEDNKLKVCRVSTPVQAVEVIYLTYSVLRQKPARI